MTATPSTPLRTSLEGKWVWIWSWPKADGGDAAKVASRLKGAGCQGALVKAHDGPHWRVGSFDQGQPWREIARSLKGKGIKVGGWGYLYGGDIAGEAQRAIETIQYGEADLYVLDVETEFKGHPQAAEKLCQGIRQAVGQDYPLYYSSFAIARYHREFPYEVFNRHCTGAAPQVYWNAFGWPVEKALGWMYEDYAALGVTPDRIFPVAGVYREGSVPYPSAASLRAFGKLAASRGSLGVSFWSYQHMDAAMWKAVGDVQLATPPGPTVSLWRYRPLHRRSDEFWNAPFGRIVPAGKLNLRAAFGLPAEARFVDILLGVRGPRVGAYVALYDPPGRHTHLVAYACIQNPEAVQFQPARVQLTRDGSIYWKVRPLGDERLRVFLLVVGVYV